MIAVDASALLSALLNDEDADVYLAKLARSGSTVMSAVNYWETLVRAQVLHREPGRERVERLMSAFDIRVVAVDAAMAREAADAFARFRGRPARLNLGDCFAYVLAAREGDGLLYKGADFPRTDVKSALDDRSS